MTNTEPLRIMLVDDHEVVRIGLRHLLEAEPGLRVVAECGRVKGAMESARMTSPDVVLLDLRLPDGDGLDLCAAIKRERPEVKVIVLTSYMEPTLMMRAIATGADGYVLKESGSTELSKALRLVQSGGTFFDRIGGRRPGEPEATPEPSAKLAEATLTGHENRLLALVAEGKSNLEIASQMGLSEKSIRNRLSVVFAKLNVTSRTQAASVFLRSGSGSAPRGPKM